jgi:hypothetical protein
MNIDEFGGFSEEENGLDCLSTVISTGNSVVE